MLFVNRLSNLKLKTMTFFLDQLINDPLWPGIKRGSNYQMVDQDKFDLIPKKEYIEQQIKELEDAETYHAKKAQFIAKEIKELKTKIKEG